MNKNILKTAHESVTSLYDVGLVGVITMHEFDITCFPSIKKSNSIKIKMLPKRQNIYKSKTESRS